MDFISMFKMLKRNGPIAMKDDVEDKVLYLLEYQDLPIKLLHQGS